LKKLVIASLTVLFLAAFAAQPAAADFGVKGGLALSTLSFSALAEAPPLVNLKAPVGGIFFGMGFGLFSVQPEVLYVRMGGRMEEGADWIEDRLDYIQIPILLKIHVLPGPISPAVYAGPYGSFRLGAKEVENIGGVTDSFDIKDQIKSTDYGLVFGGGIDFKLPVLKLSAEVRYNLGLVNIAKNAPSGYWVKNRSLMFLVGVGF
jgi:hypothetical protein